MPGVKKHGLQKLHIYDFQFATQIVAGGMYAVFGRTGSGKSTVVLLAAQLMCFAFTAQHVVFVAGAAMRELWGQFVHDFYISPPSIAFLNHVLCVNEERTKFCKLHKATFPKEWEVVIWIDDCGDADAFLKSDIMTQLAIRGRHAHITTFILVQRIIQNSTYVRGSVHYMFGFAAPDVASIDYFSKENAGHLKKDMFKFVYDNTTRHRGMIAVNSKPTSQGILEKNVFYTHADLLHEHSHRAFDIPHDQPGALKMLGAACHLNRAKELYRAPTDNSPAVTLHSMSMQTIQAQTIVAPPTTELNVLLADNKEDSKENHIITDDNLDLEQVNAELEYQERLLEQNEQEFANLANMFNPAEDSSEFSDKPVSNDKYTLEFLRCSAVF